LADTAPCALPDVSNQSREALVMVRAVPLAEAQLAVSKTSGSAAPHLTRWLQPPPRGAG
jgi:hypothetical protein